MRGTKAKRLRKELEVSNPGRKYGGEVGVVEGSRIIGDPRWPIQRLRDAARAEFLEGRRNALASGH